MACNHEDDGEGTCLGCGLPMVGAAPKKLPKKPARERMTYRETYKKGACKFERGAMPLFVHLSDGCKPVECYLFAAGQVQRGEEVLEYQDIRVYFTV